MLKGKNVRLFFLILISCFASVLASTDSLIIQYVKSGVNGWFPFDTLKVYKSGNAELITATFTTSTTKAYSLTQGQLNDLVKLFTDNNFLALDSTYWSGCLACPEFAITYSNKTVRGNYTGGSVQFANIKAGLDSLVNKIKNPAPVVFNKGNPMSSGKNVSPFIHAELNLNGDAGRSGIVMVRKGFSGAYTILGQRMIRAH